MVRKEDVDFYCGFSRKELQSLCKKYNLPANRSSSDMAESVASYFEKQRLNSVVFGVSGNQDSSATTSRAPVSRTCDVKRDSYGNGLDITREGCFLGTMAREPGFILGDSTQYQERNGNGGMIDSAYAPPYMSEKGTTENSKKDAFCRTDSRLMKEVNNGDNPSSSSFEFHVSLEEGISLSVDLNFNPSDWIKSMRDKVNVYDSNRRRKSPHSDLGINKKQKSSGQDKEGQVRRRSSISPEMKDNTQSPYNGERFLASSAIEPCSRIKEGSDICKKQNELNFSIPDSSEPPQIVSSCVDYVNPPEKKLSSDPVMVATEQNHQGGDLLIEVPENPSMESVQKLGNSSTRVGGSELSSLEPDAYYSNPQFSPRKTSKSSNISCSELRKSTSCSESFMFRNNCLATNTKEQEKIEVLCKQTRSE